MTGPWSWASASEAYNSYYYWTPNDADYTAVWTPGSRLPAGQYDVYARWFSNEYRSQAVAYTVNHAGGASTVTVNQRLNSGTWVLLGRYNFNAGAGNVTFSNTLDGTTTTGRAPTP